MSALRGLPLAWHDTLTFRRHRDPVVAHFYFFAWASGLLMRLLSLRRSLEASLHHDLLKNYGVRCAHVGGQHLPQAATRMLLPSDWDLCGWSMERLTS